MEGGPPLLLFLHPVFEGLFSLSQVRLVDASQGRHTVLLGGEGADEGDIDAPVEARVLSHGLHGATHTAHGAADNRLVLDVPPDTAPFPVQALVCRVDLQGVPVFDVCAALRVPAPFDDLEEVIISCPEFLVHDRLLIRTCGAHLCLFVVVIVVGEGDQPRPGEELRIGVRVPDFFEEGRDMSVCLLTEIGLPVRADSGKGHEEIDNQDHNHDDGDDLLDEDPGPFQTAAQDPLHRGQVIGRHLQDKGGRFHPPEQGHAQDLRYGECRNNGDRGDEKHDNPLVGGKEHPHQEDVEGDLGHAVHERTDQHGRQLRLFVLDDTAGHDPRDRAPPDEDAAQYHGEGGLPVETEIPEDTIK